MALLRTLWHKLSSSGNYFHDLLHLLLYMLLFFIIISLFLTCSYFFNSVEGVLFFLLKLCPEYVARSAPVSQPVRTNKHSFSSHRYYADAKKGTNPCTVLKWLDIVSEYSEGLSRSHLCPSLVSILLESCYRFLRKYR